MPNTAQDYCEEFCRSIKAITADNGNWFGRLLAYQHLLVNFFGSDYPEADFRAKVLDGSISIISISAPSNIVSNFSDNVTATGTIAGTFDIEAEIDGERHSTTVSFEHEVKWSIHATKTTIS